MATQVTVNGVPVEQLIEQELTDEIRKIHKKDSAIPRRPLGASKHNGNLSGGRTAKGQIVYQAGQKETHVIVCGIVFPWHAKAPYVGSGQSILGALEHNEESQRIKCHECGGWFEHIGAHVKAHGINGREYRRKHGFRHSTRLTVKPGHQPRRGFTREANERGIKKAQLLRKAIPDGYHLAGNLESANLRQQCRAQLQERILELAAKLGRTPTFIELEESGIYKQTVRRRFGLSVSATLALIGLEPRKRGHYLPGPAHYRGPNGQYKPAEGPSGQA